MKLFSQYNEVSYEDVWLIAGDSLSITTPNGDRLTIRFKAQTWRDWLPFPLSRRKKITIKENQ